MSEKPFHKQGDNEMKTTNKITAALLAFTITAGTLIAPIAANASEEGKRNTTIGFGALALGLLLTQKNKLPGIVAAGGAAYAYSQYDASVRNRHRREKDDYYYRNGERDNRNNDSDYRHNSRDNRNHNNDSRNQDGYRYGENGHFDGRAAHR